MLEKRSWPVTDIRVAQSADGGQKLEWYAAVFDSLSEDLGGFRERIGRRAFTRTIQDDDIRALINHDPNLVLGRNKAGTLALKVDTRGLRATVTLPDTQAARDLVVSIDRGDITGGSFAFQVRDEKWGLGDDGEALRTVNDLRLFDVSPVTYPAYPDTNGSASVRSLLGLSDEALRVLARAKAGQPPTAETSGELRGAIALLQGYLPEEQPEPVIEVAPPTVALRALRRRLEMAYRA